MELINREKEDKICRKKYFISDSLNENNITRKIFYDTDDYLFGSKRKDKGVSLEELEKSGKNYVYFASIQDLRGSDLVGGKFDKNEEVFETEWDYWYTGLYGQQNRTGFEVLQLPVGTAGPFGKDEHRTACCNSACGLVETF